MSDQGFAIIERTSVWRSVAAQLRNLVETGAIEAHQRLPSERELCERFGVSRVSLREAMKALEREGYIEVQHGKGAFVRSRAERGQAILSTFMLADAASAAKVFELRLLFEPSLAALAARRIDAAALAVLAASVEELESLRGDPKRAIEADAAFHRALGEYAGNSLIEGLVHFVMSATGAERRITLADQDGIAQAARGHRDVFERIAARDPEGAADAMRRHLLDAIRFSSPERAEP